MRRLVGLALAAIVVLVAGTAFAENGTIQPFRMDRVRIQAGNGTVNPLENSSVIPW